MSRPDYYKILGVSRTASEREIKAAYRQLALRYHPDLHPNNPHADEVLKAINEAYDVLGDVRQRRQYDEAQFIGVTPTTTPTARRQTSTWDWLWSMPPQSAAAPRRKRTISWHFPSTEAIPGFRDTLILVGTIGWLFIVMLVISAYLNSAASVENVSRPIELTIRTPTRELLLASLQGNIALQETLIPKTHLVAGDKLVLNYRVQLTLGRIFIGLKGQLRGSNGAALFARGEWVNHSQSGTIEITIPRADDYLIVLNLDNFAGTVTVEPQQQGAGAKAE